MVGTQQTWPQHMVWNLKAVPFCLQCLVTFVILTDKGNLLAMKCVKIVLRTTVLFFFSHNFGKLWQTFNRIQKLLAKTKGKVVGDVMTPAPLVVHETTNLEDAARYVSFPYNFSYAKIKRS